MKILIASTPATGHLNPLLAVARVLIADGHDVTFLSGTALRRRIEGDGAKFRPLPGGADLDLRDILAIVPELKNIPPGPEWLHVAMDGIFVDTVRPQHEGLLQNLPVDVIVADDMYFGVLPMLLGALPNRPPVVLCGTSFLHWRRDDGAPHFAGLPPATTPAQREGIPLSPPSMTGSSISPRPIAQPDLESLGAGPLADSF